MKNNLFHFSYKKELEEDKSWQIDISPFFEGKLSEEAIYQTKLLKDVLAILVFDIKGESNSYLIFVDTTNKKLLNFFPLKTQPRLSSLAHTLNSLYRRGDDVIYQEYEHERFPKNETKNLSLHYNDEIGKHIQTFYVRKLGTDEVKKYQIDQSNYYVGKAQVYLLEDGTLQCVGLYSKLPQTRLLFRNVFEFESVYTNNVRGIFVQNFKDGQKISDEKIPLTPDIIEKAVTELDGSIALATLASAPRLKNKTTLMTIESTLYSDNQQRRSRTEKITLCIDERGKVSWWNLLHVGRGEGNLTLKQLQTEEEKQTDEKYTTLIVSEERIKAYKAVCGTTSTKTFEIPSKINGYKYISMQDIMNKDNDTYILYRKGKKNILVKFKTGEAFRDILD